MQWNKSSPKRKYFCHRSQIFSWPGSCMGCYFIICTAKHSPKNHFTQHRHNLYSILQKAKWKLIKCDKYKCNTNPIPNESTNSSIQFESNVIKLTTITVYIAGMGGICIYHCSFLVFFFFGASLSIYSVWVQRTVLFSSTNWEQLFKTNAILVIVVGLDSIRFNLASIWLACLGVSSATGSNYCLHMNGYIVQIWISLLCTRLSFSCVVWVFLPARSLVCWSDFLTNPRQYFKQFSGILDLAQFWIFDDTSIIFDYLYWYACIFVGVCVCVLLFLLLSKAK